MGSLGNRFHSQNLILLCILCIVLVSESRPKRRSVSEVQLMHDLGRLLYDCKRQELIKDVVRDIHTASGKDITPNTEPLRPKYSGSCQLAPAARRQKNKGRNRRPRNSEMERAKGVSADTTTPQDPGRLPKPSHCAV